jgi:hypothetical protein
MKTLKIGSFNVPAEKPERLKDMVYDVKPIDSLDLASISGVGEAIVKLKVPITIEKIDFTKGVPTT